MLKMERVKKAVKHQLYCWGFVGLDALLVLGVSWATGFDFWHVFIVHVAFSVVANYVNGAKP